MDPQYVFLFILRSYYISHLASVHPQDPSNPNIKLNLRRAPQAVIVPAITGALQVTTYVQAACQSSFFSTRYNTYCVGPDRFQVDGTPSTIRYYTFPTDSDCIVSLSASQPSADAVSTYASNACIVGNQTFGKSSFSTVPVFAANLTVQTFSGAGCTGSSSNTTVPFRCVGARRYGVDAAGQITSGAR